MSPRTAAPRAGRQRQQAVQKGRAAARQPCDEQGPTNFHLMNLREPAEVALDPQSTRQQADTEFAEEQPPEGVGAILPIERLDQDLQSIAEVPSTKVG